MGFGWLDCYNVVLPLLETVVYHLLTPLELLGSRVLPQAFILRHCQECSLVETLVYEGMEWE